MEPTYDELLQIVESLHDRVKDLEKAGAEKDKRIDKLEKELHKYENFKLQKIIS